MNDDAEKLLDEVHKLAANRMRATTVAAKAANLVLVDKDRLAKLEALVIAVQAAMRTTRMTRAYKELLEHWGEQADHYNGKRWLVRREDGGNVARAMVALNKDVPIGSLA